MSSFLWIEDFEGGQYREFSYKIFGQALGLPADSFGETETDLKSFLEGKQIFLLTTLAEGIKFIDDESQLRKVDFIILDIDLALMGVDIADDESLIKPLLEKWYNYRSTDANEEQSFNRACDELKRVAGYHLYIDLVAKFRFPRDRIMFCSNHGGYLKAIQESFSGAKIEPPQVLTKADPNISRSIIDFYADDYSKLRRNIISICDELGQALRFGQAEFILPKFLYGAEDSFKVTDGTYLLSVLPLLLPPYLSEREELTVIFRQFVRALTQDFDKVNYRDIPRSSQKLPFLKVLHSARNWMSHDSKAMARLEIGDVAYMFLIFLQSCFSTKSKSIKFYENNLLELISPSAEFKEEELMQAFIVSFQKIEQRGSTLCGEDRIQFYDNPYFERKLNLLALFSNLNPGEHEKFIYQIFWHSILYLNDQNKFSTQSIYFVDKSPILDQLIKRTFTKAFRPV